MPEKAYSCYKGVLQVEVGFNPDLQSMFYSNFLIFFWGTYCNFTNIPDTSEVCNCLYFL